MINLLYERKDTDRNLIGRKDNSRGRQASNYKHAAQMSGNSPGLGFTAKEKRDGFKCEKLQLLIPVKKSGRGHNDGCEGRGVWKPFLSLGMDLIVGEDRVWVCGECTAPGAGVEQYSLIGLPQKVLWEVILQRKKWKKVQRSKVMWLRVTWLESGLDINQGAMWSLQTRYKSQNGKSQFLKVKFGHTSERISEKV